MAGFGEVEVEDAHLESAGGVLTVPLLRARLPILRSLKTSRLHIASLSAKGWMLDLSRAQARAAPAGQGKVVPAGAPARPWVSSAAEAASLAMSAFRSWQVPFAGSVDGVELEGDVLLASQPGGAPVQVHLLIKGGGFGAGRKASFDVEAAVVGAQIPAAFTFARGHVLADLGADGRLGRLDAKADFSPAGDSDPNNPGMSVEVSADRGRDGSTFEVNAARGARRLATVRAQADDASGRLAGSWSVDLRGADVAPFGPYAELPSATVAGGGSFEASRPFDRVRARGRLKAAVERLAGVAPMLERAGNISLDAEFDVTAGAASLTVAGLNVSADAAGAAVAFRTLKAFDFDPGVGLASLPGVSGDFIEGSFRNLPLALLSGPASRMGFADGRASGEFTVRAADGKLSLELKRPATASGVALLGPGRLLGAGLEASLSLKASYASGAWDIAVALLAIRRAGRDLASLEATATRPAGAGQAFSVRGAWSVDPQAVELDPGSPGAGLAHVKSLSGSFTATVAESVSVTGKVAAMGRDPGRTFSADVRADIDSEGDFTFTVPARVALGKDASEFTADGGVSFDTTETRIEAKVEGDDVALAHLGLLAGPLMALQAPARAPGAPPAARTPAWGALKGRVEFSFKHLRTADDTFEGVSGVFTLDHGSVRLNGGRVWLLQHDLAFVTGLLTFDPFGKPAYDLKANVSVSDFDAAAVFGKASSERLAPVEGRFSFEDTVTADGADLAGLVGSAQEDMKVRSSGGILRLLKVDVADAIPEEKTRVSDTLGTVGSAVGAIFGVKHDSDNAGKNPVSKAAEAVLSFTYDISEIGYDKLAARILRDPQGGMHLTDIDVEAPNEHITGAGEIAYARGLGLPARPSRGTRPSSWARRACCPARRTPRATAPWPSPSGFGARLSRLTRRPGTTSWRRLPPRRPPRARRPSERAPTFGRTQARCSARPSGR
jgi:hypothetical protein